MKRRRIAMVVGTRPEAIKMAPVYASLKADPRAEAILVVTAQHRQMLDQALKVFDIHSDIDLNLMQPEQSLADITGRVVVGIHEAVEKLQPDAVLVQGDTTTCLASALGAFYAKVPVGHVEAGLRTHNLDAPWPEELNRRLVDPICRWCFAPTRGAARNLIDEGIPENRIFVTGNTVVDALYMAQARLDRERAVVPNLDMTQLEGKRLILVTGHRRESFGEPFRQFCLALRTIVRAHPDTALVYPVHLNPNVQRPVHEILAGEERVHLIPPTEYLPFVFLMERSYLIITDSGGIQEEASALMKPVLVTRLQTERPEAVEAGKARLVGTNEDTIVAAASRLLTDARDYGQMTLGHCPFGDGTAGGTIAKILLDGDNG